MDEVTFYLDRDIRRHMRAEFFADLVAGKLVLDERLNASGRLMFPIALEAAIEKGDVETLATALREGAFVREWEEWRNRHGLVVPRNVPWNAADKIAMEAFNAYYVRAVCRKAVLYGETLFSFAVLKGMGT